MPKRPSETPGTLPASIIAAAPISADIAMHLNAIFEYLTVLEMQLREADRSGSQTIARAFVVMRRLKDKVNEVVGEGGRFTLMFEQMKNETVPAAFERDKVPHVALSEGFRVGVSMNVRAGMRAGMKDEAIAWLKADPHLRDLVIETVNSSTLSSAAKSLIEDQNRDLPEALFNVALVPTTSVVTTKVK